MDFLITTNPLTWYEALIRVVAAVVVGALVGLDREYKNRPAGLRTHSLVCLGATVVAILEGLLVWRLLALDGPESVNVSIGRISAQVVSGIGFLGAVAIFVELKMVSWLTTAAAL